MKPAQRQSHSVLLKRDDGCALAQENGHDGGCYGRPQFSGWLNDPIRTATERRHDVIPLPSRPVNAEVTTACKDRVTMPAAMSFVVAAQLCFRLWVSFILSLFLFYLFLCLALAFRLFNRSPDSPV
jgi:hypothetical protein